jgi:hypothetical protein
MAGLGVSKVHFYFLFFLQVNVKLVVAVIKIKQESAT